MNNKHKSKLKISLIIILIVLVLVISILLIINSNKQSSNIIDIPDIQTTSNPKDDKQEQLVKQLWQDNSAISSDYIGTITFASGIIDLPFVQGNDNDTYYRTNWETMEYDDQGSIFMDCSNTLDDQNIILIGHYVYPIIDPSGTAKFTPLKLLLDESNYQDNNIVYLYLHNQVRTYQVAYVYYTQLIEEEIDGQTIQYTQNGYEFYLPNYTQQQFDTYIANVEKDKLYDTGITIDYSDSMLTLQTCVENRDDLREIVLLKEIDVVNYND